MSLNEQHFSTLDRFHKWVKTLFGKAEPVFSCKYHVRSAWEVEINRGTMRLMLHGNGAFSLYDYSQGCAMAVITSQFSLEEVLMAGLVWAVRQKFYDTYPS